MQHNYQLSEITTLPMIPLRDAVLFPGMMMPFLVGRESSLKALEVAMGKDRIVFLATQHSPQAVNPPISEIHSVGLWA